MFDCNEVDEDGAAAASIDADTLSIHGAESPDDHHDIDNADHPQPEDTAVEEQLEPGHGEGEPPADEVAGHAAGESLPESESQHVQPTVLETITPPTCDASDRPLSGIHLPLLMAAPCLGYQDLRTFKDMEDMSELFNACLSLQNVKEQVNELSNFTRAAKSLGVSWKGSVGQLKSALKGFKESENSMKEASVKGKDKKDKGSTQSPAALSKSNKKSKQSSILDIALEMGTELLSFDARNPNWKSDDGAAVYFGHDDLQDDDSIEVMIPYVLRGADLSLAANFRDKKVGDQINQDIKKSLLEFMKDYGKSTFRTEHQRAQRKNDDDDGNDESAIQWVQTRLEESCPTSSYGPAAMEKGSQLRKLCALNNFAFTEDSFHVSQEKSNLWTARLTTDGLRTVVFVDEEATKSYMNQKGIASTPKEYFTTLSLAGFREFSQEVNYYCSTIQEGDLVWTPCNIITIEKIGKGKDSFGLKFGMVTPRDTHNTKSIAAVANLKSTPSGHVSKQILRIVQQHAEQIVAAQGC